MSGTRSIAAGTLILLAGCTSLFGRRQDPLSYAQFNSLQKGLGLEAVQTAFGRPFDVLEREGVTRGLSYLCENQDGRVGTLRMTFDAAGHLDKWALKGPA